MRTLSSPVTAPTVGLDRDTEEMGFTIGGVSGILLHP
jgi:hypothetical protein